MFTMPNLTTRQAAEQLGISEDQLTLLARRGEIPGAYKFGAKVWVFPGKAVSKALSRRRARAAEDGRMGRPVKVPGNNLEENGKEGLY